MNCQKENDKWSEILEKSVFKKKNPFFSEFEIFEKKLYKTMKIMVKFKIK